MGLLDHADGGYICSDLRKLHAVSHILRQLCEGSAFSVSLPAFAIVRLLKTVVLTARKLLSRFDLHFSEGS